ncbi:MAG: transposase family protein [Acidimicrobiales bacterium]
MDGSSDATELLGMGDFVVLATTLEDNERYVLVKTRDRVVGCPTCGVIATGHGRSVVQVRDLPMSGTAVRLVWRKPVLLSRRGLSSPELHRGERPRRVTLSRRELPGRSAGGSARTATRSPKSPGSSASAGRRRCERSVATAGRSSTTQPASKG